MLVYNSRKYQIIVVRLQFSLAEVMGKNGVVSECADWWGLEDAAFVIKIQS